MASRSVKITTMIMSIILILVTEICGWMIIRQFNIPPLAVIGLIRILQITTLVYIVIKQEDGLSVIGWTPVTWISGLKKGSVWSLIFGAMTAIAMVAIYATGQNPLDMIKSPLPSKTWEIGLFFVVGGIIAPVAEELCFRGIIYTFFRRWGIIIALLASTAIFVVLHTIHGFPVIQIVGGVVFAIAYETSGNLMVPITIHSLGNTAIFILSLL